MSKKDQSFPTWSFDKPCTSMAWNELAPIKLTASTNVSSYRESDLVLVGIYSQDSSNEEDDDTNNSDDDSAPAIVLTGAAKDLDDTLGGLLTEVISDNAKTFKAGAMAGSMTPTVRVAAAAGGKVRWKK
jgi:hypothetical protein